MDNDKVIKQMREKNDTQILEKVLDEVQAEESPEVRAPDPEELGLNTTTYHIPASQGLRLNWETSEGQYAIPFIKIANMLNSGLSPIIGIFGKEQTGKSNTYLYMNHVIHNELNLVKGDFDPVQQTIYEVIPFITLLRSTKRRAVGFEEAGETINKNDYNSKMNHAVAGSLRTQSKRQIPYFFITPEASELDPRVREKIDIEIEMIGTGRAKITLYERIHGRRAENKQQRYEYAAINETWKVPKAPKDTRKRYDDLDSEFKGRYLDELLMGAIEEKMDEDDGVKDFS